MAVPTQDELLLGYAGNFSSRVTASPTTFALSAGEASALAALLTPFQSAMAALAGDGAKSKALVTVKNDSKRPLLANLRELYAIVQASTGVLDSDKELLGVVVRKTTTTPLPAPAFPPSLTIKSVRGYTVEVQLRDSTNTAPRGKPAAVSGASLFSYVGETPPARISDWKFEGSTGHCKSIIDFDPTLPAGTRVYLCAFWFNPAKLSGPACDPVATNLQGGGVSVSA